MAGRSERKLLLLKKKLLLLQKKRSLTVNKHKRKDWVHPINQKRHQLGLYQHLVQELRHDEERFRKYFRMTPDHFDDLLTLVRPLITKQDTVMRAAIQPGLKLAITLHHLAEGASHCSIAAHYRLGRSTTSMIIYETADALWTVLQPIYLKPPSSLEEWRRISDGYV